MAYDVLIKSGTIIDGTGAVPVLGDVGIDGDKISAVGDLGNASAKTVINAYGKYVTPGFVDLTNHSDTQLTLFKYPGLESMATQGVTTIVGGNCGASLAPLGSPAAIGAIKKWADPSEINLDWATMKEFLDTAEKLGPELNFATFVGYGTLRRGVIGDQIRLLALEEKQQVKFLLREAMVEGAFGLSLGLLYGHERISTTEEIIEIAKVLEQTGGVIKVHLRSEGFDMLSSINEVIRIAREVRVPVQISHLKAIGRKSWPSLPRALEFIANARASGLDVNYDVSPYRTTGSPLYLLIPGWARQGGFSALFKRIDDPAERQKIIEALKRHTLHYEKVLLTSAAKTKDVVGKTLLEVSQSMGLEPEETLLSMVRVNEGRVSIIGQTVAMKNTKLEMKDPNSFIASDGAGFAEGEVASGNLLHPRSFGAFPRFLGKYMTALGISPAEAIKKITSGPAEKIGIKNRGTIKKKNFADVVVFDPKTLKDNAVYKDPYHYVSGIDWVIVNGKISVKEGKYIGARAGRVLRRGI